MTKSILARAEEAQKLLQSIYDEHAGDMYLDDALSMTENFISELKAEQIEQPAGDGGRDTEQERSDYYRSVL